MFNEDAYERKLAWQRARRTALFWGMVALALAGIAFIVDAATSPADARQRHHRGVLLVAPAAPSGVVTQSCFGGSCITVWGHSGNPHVISVPGPRTEDERRAAEERDAEWIARCRPEPYRDAYGMTRYRYAVPGCEHG